MVLWSTRCVAQKCCKKPTNVVSKQQCKITQTTGRTSENTYIIIMREKIQVHLCKSVQFVPSLGSFRRTPTQTKLSEQTRGQSPVQNQGWSQNSAKVALRGSHCVYLPKASLWKQKLNKHIGKHSVPKVLPLIRLVGVSDALSL